MIRSEKGVTLIELLAAIAILATVIGLVTTVIYQSNLGYKTISSRGFVQERSRMLTEHLVNEVRSKPYTVSDPNPTGNGSVLLELTDKSDTNKRIRYVYDAAAHTISVEKIDSTTTTVVKLADQVANASNEKIVKVSDDKIEIYLKFALSNTNKHEYRTTIYVPSWK